ncbi:MAG: alanine--tRNA ligase [Candidatus Thermoplasmatota archaeon]|nr:alanine--tRNA ligase [Candidatus Thermoplasmatota archaeon]
MNEFLQKELDLHYFHENDYVRKRCEHCGCYYWTLDEQSTLCGDQPCIPFSFIHNPIGHKKLSLLEVREGFLRFFEKHGHKRLQYPIYNERYPVIARWRSDIYLTIASIADFQPHVTSGEVPAPANPLVISQPCIRLNDLDQVGISGRHLTTFEMMGHHAFNKQTDEIYWKEDTVDFCNDFFIDTIGIPKQAINYKEQLWNGGGNAGPCLEVVAKGLEIATLVFMNMKADKKGEYVIENETYTNNPLNIVDTGYGLERISWITHGTENIYEAVFPNVLNWIKNHAKDLSDTQAFYSLADHSKALSFMLGDGVVPSNVKAGYLARLLIRRALRFINILRIDANLEDIVTFQLHELKSEFPSLITQKDTIIDMLKVETRRYQETLSKGETLVRRIIQDNQPFTPETLIKLYDTHGMPPAIVQSIAEKEQVPVVIPENFDSMLATLHSREKDEENVQQVQRDLPVTQALYYQDHYLKEFDADVLWTKQISEGTEVILDKTTFYPEGGGQPDDKGTISLGDKVHTVQKVYKENESIIHLIDGILHVGDKVRGRIDWDRRYQLMKHHTGTHVVNGALQDLFGSHIWQAGSQLGITEARFDYAHYKPLSQEDIQKVEQRSNELIQKHIEVHKKILDRNTAEKTYGFRLYQGGVPPGDSLRVLDIPGVDVEACGGTHLNNIGEIEKIRILKSERIQDGVNRIVFAAGTMVDRYQQEERAYYDTIIKILEPTYHIIKEPNDVSSQLKEVTLLFSVPLNQLEKTLTRFLEEAKFEGTTRSSSLSDACTHLFDQWKKTKKQEKNISTDQLENLIRSAEDIPGTSYKVIIGRTDADGNATAGSLTQRPSYIVHIYDGRKITSAASENVPIDLREGVASEIGRILGGSGGGRSHMTQSGGPNNEQVDAALLKAKELTIKLLKKE